MDEINVDVIVSNGTNVEVSSPSTLVNAHVNLPPPIESTTDSPSIDYRTHVILPGPQGPAGPIGPVGPQGLQGNISGINDLNAPVIYLSGQDGITVYSGSYNTLCISGNSGYFQDQINLLTLNLFNTGNSLYLLQYNYSGWANNQFATNANLLITGNLLQGQINALVTNFALTGSGLQAQIDTLTTNLFTTGSTLATNLALTGSSLQTQVNTLTTNLFTTGSTLATSIANYSGWAANTYATISNLNLTGSSLALQIYNTGSILDSKINSLSGVSVLTFGNQNIYGNKTFYDTVFINNLTVTGAETIVNTQNFNVQSPYILLNLTGGAVDGGIFFVTGAGLTGINDSGPIIGFDHSDNFVFGISTRASDLSTLNKIASKQDISNYSGFANSTYATITNLNTTGSNLQIAIDAVATNLNLTGDGLQTQIDILSNKVVYTTGDQNISGNKTFSDSISAKYLSGISGEDLGINCPPNSGGQGSSIRIRGGDGTNGAGTITLDAGVYYNPTPGVPNSQAALYFNAGAVYFNAVPYPKDWAARGGMIIYKSGYVFGDSIVPVAQFTTSDIGGVTVIDKFTVTGSSMYTDQAIYISGNPVLTGINLSAYPNQLVYTTGNQTISGNKSFINNIEVQGTGIFNSVDLSNISEFQFSGTNINLVDGNISISGGSVDFANNISITSLVTGTLNPNGIANFLKMNINSKTYYIPMYTGTFTAI